MNKKSLLSLAVTAAITMQSNAVLASAVVTDDIKPATVKTQKQTAKGFIIGLKTNQKQLSAMVNGKLQLTGTVAAQRKALVEQLTHHGIAIEHSFKLINAVKVDNLSKKQISLLKAMDTIDYIEPNHVVELYGSSWDEKEIRPWGITHTKADQAWAESTGTGVKVGIIDNGVDGSTPDLAGVLVQEVDLAGGSNSKFHGTHIAGTIAAVHNTIGVQGIAPNVELYSIRVFNGLSGSVSTVARGIEKAVEMGLDVVNLSLGTGGSSTTLQGAVEAAYAQGLIMVAATGNDSYPWLSNPAAYPETLAIGAIRKDNSKASFSNYHSTMDFVAPGTQIESTMPVGEGFSVTLTSGGSLLESYPLDRSPIGSATGQSVKVPGMGNPEDFYDVDGNSLVTGKVALVDRGEIPMREKSINAKAAGAVGMILINSTAQDAFDYTLAFCQPDDSAQTCGTGQNVPSVVIPNSLGLELTQSLPTLTIDVAVSDYGYMSGTSMATPHATAAVALIKAKYPAYSTEDIRQVLGSTAVDLRDPGKDKYTGWGLIDIAAALSVEVEPNAPVADFNYSLNGLQISLNNLSSDADNDITAYAWDLGDGNTSTASDPVHTYGAEGVYNIVLQTTDATGLSDNKSLSVTVEEPGIAPVADFSYSVSDLTLSVAGNATDTDGTVVSYAWDFGDGNSASGQNANHSYANSGDYTVTLTVTDDEGLTDNVESVVTVTAPPVAPVADFSHVVDGLTVTLNDLSTDANNDIVSYDWDLGDGNSASEQSTVHTYADYGSYSINLTVTDSEGLSSQKSATLELSEPQGPIQLSNGVEVTGLSGVAGSELLYVLNVDDGAFLPSIKLYDGTGNADLYVAQGRIPTTTDYDEKSTTSDATETIRLWGNDVGGDWYILIKGAASYSGVTLRGKYRSF